MAEEADEGGYTAKALGHPIFTEADSYEDLKKMVYDAVKCHFDNEKMPAIIRLHFVRDEIIKVA